MTSKYKKFILPYTNLSFFFYCLVFDLPSAVLRGYFYLYNQIILLEDSRDYMDDRD